MDEIYEKIKTSLKDRPNQLAELNAWLFVTINTARAMVDNTNKEDIQVIGEAELCRTSAELQRWFDSIQGRYGREGFSYRHSPIYFYLCSLTAFFEDMPLCDENREFIKRAGGYDRYFLYEI